MIENMTTLLRKVKEDFAALVGLKCEGVVGVNQEGEDIIVTLETLEKSRIPDSTDILGVYELKVKPGGEIKDFSRIRLRNRGDTA